MNAHPSHQPGQSPSSQPGGYPPPGQIGGAPQPGGFAAPRRPVKTARDIPGGEILRFLAICVDTLLAAGVGAYVTQQVRPASEHGATSLLLLLGVALVASFVNQVVLAWLTRCSVGKLLFFLRFVSDPGDDWVPQGGYRRAGFWRLAGRWLFGLTFLPRQLVQQFLCGEAEEEGAGVLIVTRGQARGR